MIRIFSSIKKSRKGAVANYFLCEKVQLIEFEIYMGIENGVIKDLATYEITVKNIFCEYKLNRNRELFYEIILRISFLPSDLTIYYLIIRKVNDR
ncbi:unnamed protein product [Rhizophagus irregularis]|nr:unnamed protein product [Rhizophagus irregularis]CAB5213359.1 unnamed protein product [Rhizophagus irregularis]